MLILKKAFVVGPDYSVSRVFEEYGYDIVSRAKDAHILIYTGGEDISPFLYTKKAHPRSFWTRRDGPEVEIYEKYKESGRLWAGICRGAQLLTAMNGGSLYQDINRHGLGAHGHSCTYLNENGEEEHNHMVSSVHHQMCNIFTSPNKVELWGYTRLATYRDSEEREQIPLTGNEHPDVEIFYYPETRSFGFQGHPEYRNQSSSDLFFRALERADNYKG